MKIVIIGASGMAKLVMDTLGSDAKKVAGFIDANKKLHGSRAFGKPVFGDSSVIGVLAKQGIMHYMIAIWDASARKQYSELAGMFGLKPYTAIHKSASVSESAKIGEGSLICRGANIGPDARIGKHVILNIGVNVGHSCVIEDYCYLSAGVTLAGRNLIKTGVFLKAGETVLPDVTVGD